MELNRACPDSLTSAELPSSTHSAPPTPPPPWFPMIELLPDRVIVAVAPSRRERAPHRSRASLLCTEASSAKVSCRVLELPLSNSAACASDRLPEMLACGRSGAQHV